ncbi:MAG: LacI family DNA-binding transcriptional regulator [Euzebyales bacterium]|jgi:LacI family transcriptional regulator|nr:LacI family DNA-binding transcriptional regulator [Euzebyales bacterium]
MRDVAEIAGVSLKTVSRVVNTEAGVRPATAERVDAAIRQLGFRRNELARSLRHGRASATVGLVIGDVANPFYASIARAVETRARSGGSVLITGSSDEVGSQERELVGMLLTRRVDGLLVVPAAGDHGWLAEEVRRGVHIVFLDRPPHGLVADSVVFDNVGGGRRAVRHLLAHGYQRIAIIGDAPSVHTIRERYDGYAAALKEAGLPVDPRLARLSPHDAEGAARAVRELLTLPEPPDAVFACNNRMTVGVLHALRAARAPLGLVGFDDFELADLLGVTVVSGSAVEMGGRGADLLFARLGGDDRPARRIVLSPTLVARGSGERVSEEPA